MVTRLQLRDRSKRRADQVGVDTTVWDPWYNDWLDDSAKEVWADLIQAGWPVDFSTANITASGATTYQVAAGTQVYAVVGVYYKLGSDFYVLRRLNPGKYAQLRSQQGVTGYAEFYELRLSPTQGLVIELLPHPGGGSYTVDYIAEYPGFSGDSDTWYGPMGSDELITLRTAIKAMRKEGQFEDADVLEKEYQQRKLEVMSRVSVLDMRNPAMIRDVTSQKPRFAIDYPVAGPDGYGDF
jgi:hypothetical protein